MAVLFGRGQFLQLLGRQDFQLLTIMEHLNKVELRIRTYTGADGVERSSMEVVASLVNEVTL